MQDQSTEETPQWNVPGWDWKPEDHAWLSSESGLYHNETSIFFIHGGRIRHQAHIPHGDYSIEAFTKMLQAHAKGLDGVTVRWMDDTDGGGADLWVEGTRPPNASDLARLQSARERQLWDQKLSYMTIRKAHPEWFTSDVRLDEHGRPV